VLAGVASLLLGFLLTPVLMSRKPAIARTARGFVDANALHPVPAVRLHRLLRPAVRRHQPGAPVVEN